MKRITLTVACLALLGLTACGGGDSGKKPSIRKGKLAGLSINKDGELMLAPRFQQVFQTEQPFVWSTASDSKGTPVSEPPGPSLRPGKPRSDPNQLDLF